jgi:single-strand DNA-binding protein
MAGVNKVILLGNLGADPEVKHLEGEKVVANLTLATTESYTDKSGNRVDQTEWHDLELWDGLAKIAEKYLKKGMQVYVEGKIKSDKWVDEQGQNRKKSRIRVLNLTMLGKPEGAGTPPPDGQQSSRQSAPTTNSSTPIEQNSPISVATSTPPTVADDADDDLPF